MNTSILFAWLGMTDLKASRGELKGGLGPIGQAVKKRSYSYVVLLSNSDSKIENPYIEWLNKLSTAKIIKHHVKLSGPTRFGEIYEAADISINKVKKRLKEQDLEFTFHLSPGTPAMASVWIILSKTIHPAALIESSIEEGVKTVDLPFDISADYLPHMVHTSDDEITKLTMGLPPEAPAFDEIIHRSKEMKRVVAKARRLAIHNVPILIQGESGTGKELLSRAIHASSSRRDKPFVAVNCGAIPPHLVESEFFGHKKGSFTGATHDRKGHFLEANGGTLFLDEIGELPLPAQVTLLRALQEGIITHIGTSKQVKVDVRVIAASNRNLIEALSDGNFREDLFHRLAVGVLYLPPLRERQGDLNLLIDRTLEEINQSFAQEPGWIHKNISVNARNIMHQHSWPGNIRELKNTLSRAMIWNSGKTIQADDIKEALLPTTSTAYFKESILDRNLGNGFNIQDVIADVARHYLNRALRDARGNKTLMAKLVGLPNYQTLSNWLRKYEIEE